MGLLTPHSPPPIAGPDVEWLARRVEDVIDPGQPIVDPHFHLLTPPHHPYSAEDFAADLSSGHNVVATVFVDCLEGYLTTGPEHLRSVGETQFAASIGERSSAGDFGHKGLCSGVISRADLQLGQGVAEVLEAHIAAGRGRFKGTRYPTAVDTRTAALENRHARPEGILRLAAVREAAAVFSRYDLCLETMVYHPQLGDVADLAAHCPDTRIVLDHVGTPIGVGAYASERAEVFEVWRRGIAEVARRPNVTVKLGALAMGMAGFGFHERPTPPSSEDLAEEWRPYIETCVEAFGPDRAMFESNFPVDKLSCSYRVLWNAFKRLASGYSDDERAALFGKTAAGVYRLDAML